MPTRAAAAAAAAANMRTTRSRKVSTQPPQPQPPQGKENNNVASPLPPVSSSASTKGKEKAAAPKKAARNVKAKKVEAEAEAEVEVFCSCRGVDDGTPMVQCGTCNEWYHFGCIQLSEDDASEIMVYVCPSCQEKTGRRTVMEWEGFDALEPIENVATEDPSGIVKTQTKRAEKLAAKAQEQLEESETEWKQRPQHRPSPPELSESSDDESGDEYVDEGDRREDAAAAGGNSHKRMRANSSRRIAVPSSSDSEEEDDGRENKVAAAGGGAHARRTTVSSTRIKQRTISSTSPQPVSLKRKQSVSATGAAAAPTPPKRKRAESSSTTADATEDAARKYCLGKFAEMFTGIFMQYPYVQQESNVDKEGEEDKKSMVERKPEELTEEDKTHVRERATVFATEVEQAVFDTYAEPDKYGKQGAGVKYKERFRTLTFNLQQSDRVALHKRISSGQVVPATLSTMSSTELASQEQQESIKQAEQEALEHSILIKTTVPRSKITHKGLQDIEDVNEDSAVAKRREREQLEVEMAEQERERERLARLRTVQPLQHAHSNPPSASVPPESPTVPPTRLLAWARHLGAHRRPCLRRLPRSRRPCPCPRLHLPISRTR
ncbi:transcription factor S-II, central domain-containing protein [Russula compacta]|nr:transcription factor S-II, central domain-containing protein [Russula compacta]